MTGEQKHQSSRIFTASVLCSKKTLRPMRDWSMMFLIQVIVVHWWQSCCQKRWATWVLWILCWSYAHCWYLKLVIFELQLSKSTIEVLFDHRNACCRCDWLHEWRTSSDHCYVQVYLNSVCLTVSQLACITIHNAFLMCSGPDTNGMKELMDSIGTPSPCLPIACPKNTDGLACNPDQLKNCKAIAGYFI